ncbi:MAG: DNA translocase FtsK 4TM domain-containing protein [Bacteroidales bacterium]|nr:DNA translocase FtsK 4TM domain-containing protein [Bacteroidales bacterium]
MSREEKNIRKNTLKSDSVNPVKRKKPRKSSKRSLSGFFRNEKFQRIVGLFLILLSVYMFLAFTSYLISWFSWGNDDFISGIPFKDILFDNTIEIHNWTGKIGAVLAHRFIKEWFGIASYFFIFILLLSGIKLLFKISLLPIGKSTRYSFLGLLWLSITLGLIFFMNSELLILGGAFGYQSSIWLQSILGKPGEIILLSFVLLSFLIFTINFKLSKIRFRKVKKEMDSVDQEVKKNIFWETTDSPQESQSTPTIESVLEVEGDDTELKPEPDPLSPDGKTGQEGQEVDFVVEEGKDSVTNNEISKNSARPGSLETAYDPTLDLPHYKFPPLDILEDYGSGSVKVNKEELEDNKNRIVKTLNNYAISIDKIKATIGPAVTLYEIIPSPGVRISKIKNLEDDIALSLAALGIRIIAPIPGKGTIGIEVPNQKPETVSIKSILESQRFQNCNFSLPFGLGKTITNESYIADLTKMPHILMAGATGQGKSVGLNAIIASLLYKKHPSQVKFVLIDPKKVELTLYSKIGRHFLAKLPDSEEAIITDTRKVVRTLNSLNIEMDSRYNLLKNAVVRNIKEYNTKFLARKLNPNDGHRFLPYIIVVVDEFADLIMTAGKEIESPLTRLAQLARAVGIHLIIATQRPSVNIITGTIKANFPARIAFRVISKIDSRTILDSSGAEQLIGRGDMLLSTGSDLVRLQCAFVDTPELDRLTEYIGSQRGYPDAFHLPEYLDEEDETNKEFDSTERDELFEDAARLVVQHQHGSTSLLQRKLKIGYNRAGRIIDQLEAVGIVGHFEGSKAREVKIKTEMALVQFLKDIEQKKEFL